MHALDELVSSLSALGGSPADYWAKGFGDVARDLEHSALQGDRQEIYLLVGRMLRGGMGSVNDLYSPEPNTYAAFRSALDQVHHIFRLGSVRRLLDDLLLGRKSWYR